MTVPDNNEKLRERSKCRTSPSEATSEQNNEVHNCSKGLVNEDGHKQDLDVTQPQFDKIIVPSSSEKVLLNLSTEIPLLKEEWMKGGYHRLPPLTQLEAKTAIHGHVTRHWYNGKSSNRISIICIKTASTWHYDITTVIETRREINAETPYQGPIGGNRGDVRPSLWEMKIPIPNDHHRKRVKIPSTSSLSECDSCSGRGFVTCSNCSGSGRDSCYHCGESGHITVHESRSEYNTMTGQTLSRMHPRSECCHYCSGAGYSECVYCRGRRKNSCRRCKETGQVEKFKQAEVTWTTKQDHHFKNPTHVDLTEESLHKCKGVVVFENQNERSEPITTRDCLNSEMVLASKHLTKRHKIIPSGAQIRQQRQRISLIPVYKVVCHKGSKLKTYFVAGTNRKVFSRSSSVNNVSSVDCCIL